MFRGGIVLYADTLQEETRAILLLNWKNKFCMSEILDTNALILKKDFYVKFVKSLASTWEQWLFMKGY